MIGSHALPGKPVPMTFHEFGTQNPETILLLHPSGVMWDYFTNVIPLLEERFHLIIPAFPGYDKSADEDFTSVEAVADRIAAWLMARDLARPELIYGCSMGGAVAIRLLADPAVKASRAILDGAITPYELPWLITRLLAVRDFLMVSTGKFGGLKLLEKAFHTDDYSAEDLRYIADVLKFMSYKTIWRSFDSCNNYAMPPLPLDIPTAVTYWYGEKETRARKYDMRYVRKAFPQATFRCFPGLGHAALASKHAEQFAEEVARFAGQGDRTHASAV